jgi:hypothetical protein
MDNNEVQYSTNDPAEAMSLEERAKSDAKKLIDESEGFIIIALEKTDKETWRDHLIASFIGAPVTAMLMGAATFNAFIAKSLAGEAHSLGEDE